MLQSEYNRLHFLYQYTFAELLETQDTVIDEQGHVWAGPTRKYDMNEVSLWKAWQQSFKTRKPIPKDAMANFQNTKHLSRPPKEGDVGLDTKAPIKIEVPKAKQFTWSHSALGDFDTCPYQYAAKRVYKTAPYEETEATIWGTRVHKVAEDLVNGVAVNDPEVEKLVKPYTDLFLKQKETAEVLTEHKMGLTEGWKPCDFMAPDVCGRVISDVLVLRGDEAFVYDYKGGKRRDKNGNLKTISNTQLIINSLSVAIHFPHITRFSGKYIYLGEADPQHRTPGMAPMERKDLLPHLQELQAKIKRVKEAVEYDNFAFRPSGLCRAYCPSYDCPHNGRKK